MRNFRVAGAGACVLLSLVLSACSNPEKEKLQHVQQGDKYVAEKRDDFAIIEYASAVKLDPKFGEARLKLAKALERTGNMPAAYAEYVRAADALPNDREAQLIAIKVLLMVGRFDDAKTRSAALIAKNPKDVQALLAHANAMSALRDPDGAVAQIEEALKINPASSEVLLNLGAVKMYGGDPKEAEAAFRKAIELDPASTDARLALANFQWSAGRLPEAEATLKEVIAKDPQNLIANRMLGVLYVSTRRVKEAEQPLKMVAELSKTPAARFQLADYYVAAGRIDDAVAILNSMTSDKAAAIEAEARLATLDYVQGRHEEAHKRLDGVLERAPNYANGLVMKARWLASENKLDDALSRATAAAKADPQSAAAHFVLANIHDRRREVPDAIKEYNETLRLNPRATAAQVELSRLSLTSGNPADATRFAEEAVQAQPANITARIALAKSLVAGRNFARAETEVASLMKEAPNSAAVHTLNGMLEASKNNTAAARRSYERALELTPGFLEAVGGLTYLDLAAKAPAAAIARLESEMAKKPSAPLLALLANAHFAAGRPNDAEQDLKRAVSLDARFTPAYAMLAGFYVQQKRLDEARAEFEGIAKRDPAAVGARQMVGIILEAQGKTDEARKSYEETVNSGASAPVAANNLAVIYAEQGTNLDRALELAQQAKQRMPDDPRVDDTIGWIYYKKDLASLAVRPLEDAVKKQPNYADAHYHLGMTYAKLGDKAKARESLERALKLNPKLGGDEARKALESVSR